jgi:hypothetical protein
MGYLDYSGSLYVVSQKAPRLDTGYSAGMKVSYVVEILNQSI